MSAEELRAYVMSPGAVSGGYAGDSDLPQRAVAFLDQRDAEHMDQFGHLPGGYQADGRRCSLPSRDVALPLAMIVARGGRRDGFPGGTTAELAEWWNRRQPWANVAVVGPDPEVAAARQDMAQKIAAMAAGIVQ